MRGTMQKGIVALALTALTVGCLLYTSDAADDLLCVDLGGRRIIKKKNNIIKIKKHEKNTHTNTTHPNHIYTLTHYPS